VNKLSLFFQRFGVSPSRTPHIQRVHTRCRLDHCGAVRVRAGRVHEKKKKELGYLRTILWFSKMATVN
jgi:hypothetical protein